VTPVATFVVLFGICLAMVLPNGRATPMERAAVPADAPITDLVLSLGDSDANRYLRAGYRTAQLRALPSERRHEEVLDHWPPGMVLYYAALFTVFGPDMPVGVVVGTTTALLWALLLTAYFELLRRHVHWAVAGTMIVLILATDVMREAILGFRLYWSEGLFTWCVLAALYAAIRSASAGSNRARYGWAAATGATLGLSAYVRSVTELLGWLMIVVIVCWAIGSLVREALRRREKRRDPARPAVASTWHKHLLALVLCLVAFHAVTGPWRVYGARKLDRLGDGWEYAWESASLRIFAHVWTPDSPSMPPYARAARLNTACHVDRTTCRAIAAHERTLEDPYWAEGRYSYSDYRRLAIRAVVRHPVEYAADRMAFLVPAWFLEPSTQRKELLQNGLLLVAVGAALVLSVRRIRRSGPDLVALFFPAFAVVSLGPLVFAGLYSRFFFPLKITAIVAVFVLFALDPSRTGAPEDPAEA
jgi:hypothetical protein